MQSAKEKRAEDGPLKVPKPFHKWERQRRQRLAETEQQTAVRLNFNTYLARECEEAPVDSAWASSHSLAK